MGFGLVENLLVIVMNDWIWCEGHKDFSLAHFRLTKHMRLAMLNKESHGPKLLLDSYGRVSQREPGQDKPAIKVLCFALLSFTLYNSIDHNKGKLLLYGSINIPFSQSSISSQPKPRNIRFTMETEAVIPRYVLAQIFWTWGYLIEFSDVFDKTCIVDVGCLIKDNRHTWNK